ncbi:hypothetical protein IQ255_31235, partial [Pleurocapsales cyanobacterium LEGE 10410]|nr:hypothetical protein [Pleurocapsales cyanobacterium LEGE 10410]
MAVFDPDVNRIPYWSNPDENYNGVAMGTSSWNDNARVWGERAATIAGFKSPVPPTAPTGVNITNANSNFGSPYIEWNYNPEPNISYYEVWRKKRRKSDLY